MKKIPRGLWATLISLSSMSLLMAAAGRDLPVPDAAMNGDLAEVRTLLRQGEDVNTAQGDGMTALHWAAVQDDPELAEMLLYAGANVHATTRLGAYTPLYLASKNGNAPMVRLLLDAGADVNAVTSVGTTPLMVAAASGSTETVNLLLDHGADANTAETAKGQTALMFAAAYDRAEVVDILLKRGANPAAVTKVVDVAAQEKAATEAAKERTKQLQALARAQIEEKAESEGQPLPAIPVEEANVAERNQKSVFSKLFAWVPGVGGEKEAGETRRRRTPFGELVGNHGGLSPLHFAARQGAYDATVALVEAGADVNALTADHTTPILIATINGHFDLATYLLDNGGDPTIQSDGGATPLYAALNVQWAPRTLYPQPRAYLQQTVTYLEFMENLLERGVDPNVRLTKKLWYTGYNFDLSGVDETGATAFWRAAYALDIEAMKLLKAHGADPNLPTLKVEVEPSGGIGPRDKKDVSGREEVPVGGPAVTPLLAAAGVGYGKGFAANSHRYAPTGFLAAVTYLVEECDADVNAVDHEGYNAIHHAAARGDNEVILYLVEKGGDVTAVSREGQTTADMANGPVQRVQPFPETVALLMELGSKNSNKCVSC